VVQDNISVQMAGVYQFLLHVLLLGVSHGTSVVMVSGTVLTTATRPDAPVSLRSISITYVVSIQWPINNGI